MPQTITYTVEYGNETDDARTTTMTRKQRPVHGNTDLLVQQATRENPDIHTIDAIYEGTPNSTTNLHAVPVFETASHLAAREAAIAARTARIEMNYPLHEIVSQRDDIIRSMKSYLASLAWMQRDLEADLARVEATTEFDPKHHSLVSPVADFVGRGTRLSTTDLDSMTRAIGEMGYQLAKCDVAVKAAVADYEADGSRCCEAPYYVVRPNAEHHWRDTALVCHNCGNELTITL